MPKEEKVVGYMGVYLSVLGSKCGEQISSIGAMTKRRRKPRPEPPHWFWSDKDNCWDCNRNWNGCSSCKRLKIFRRNYRSKKGGQDDGKENRND